MENLYIIVKRKKESYDYKFDKNKNDYQNNIKNNMLDSLQLIHNGEIIFECNKVQTISNHPDYDHFDTVAPGEFQIKCFIKPITFHGEIHGIINTKDIEGQVINEDAKQLEDNHLKGRWLIHDTWYNGKRLNHAWSGACFMMYPEDLEAFNNKLKEKNVNDETIINGRLKEV